MTRTLLAALASLALVGPAAAQSKLPAFGMTYTYLDVDTSKVAECGVSRGATMKAGAFLPRYDQPGVRDGVRAALTQMHRSGFREIRTLIWFGKIKEGSRDWFDVADPARAARLVRQYQEDVAAAGFTGALLVFAPQRTSDPICRTKDWGDCFDEQSLGASSDFIVAIRQALTDKPPVPVRYDLAAESCPPDRPPLLKKTLETYVRGIVARYTALFPNDQTSVSCSIYYFDALGAQRTTDRLYAGAGPSFYLLATYRETNLDTSAALGRLLRDRPDKSKPFVVSEINYNDREHLALVLDSFAAAKVPLQSVYFWPLHDKTTKCHMDTAPPYTLYDATGGLAGVKP
ncbi:MAG TPA: hypothetical protein VEC60_15305 [Reyranella sp.]|nr:hypothetical protein [Reyranella sp.]